ncbi:hypothetical protein BJF93_21970 [Xaviernesmea oryzae]|uniref:Uncharacterized protein n=1 Tax=Xaviernesmea oryzae TaxID=464029 RepID=A0A1Q9B3T5_9HYPH|nr:hypothetical protein [Xaviernesmea oryzae]OLP62713.1 hypothetical protein BJF93_21970 [Xaviernesmea oryzae]SEM38326.1 hypothetical protein SAMN04487976_13611 [Xaviernesmea oryzae]
MDNQKPTETADANARKEDPAEGSPEIIDHELARAEEKARKGGNQTSAQASEPHAAGPHARADLTDNSRTPGAGTLSDDQADTNPGSG